MQPISRALRSNHRDDYAHQTVCSLFYQTFIWYFKPYILFLFRACVFLQKHLNNWKVFFFLLFLKYCPFQNTWKLRNNMFSIMPIMGEPQADDS